jgi:hypothetical protein
MRVSIVLLSVVLMNVNLFSVATLLVVVVGRMCHRAIHITTCRCYFYYNCPLLLPIWTLFMSNGYKCLSVVVAVVVDVAPFLYRLRTLKNRKHGQ